MANGIQGKTVVVTGAGGVLCSEFARHIAQCGGKVALLNRTLSKVEKIATEIEAAGGIPVFRRSTMKVPEYRSTLAI